MAQISEGDIGKRVTVRLRDGAGYRDLVGHLLSSDSLSNRHGEVVHFDPAEIHVWREIIEVKRTATSGAPFSIRVYELEKLASETWRAKEEEFVGGWLMRADVGVTKRANSALVLNAENHIDELIGWYRIRNLKPIVSLVPELHQELDSQFESRGFSHQLDLHVMAKDGNSIDFDRSKYEIQVFDMPSGDWLAIHNDEAIQALLARSDAKYVELRDRGTLIGIGRAGFNRDWAVLSRIWVAPTRRGEGIGKRVLEVLESVAGNRKLALQVSTENEVALNLYSAAGYKIHHTARFRELSPQINLSQDCHC